MNRDVLLAEVFAAHRRLRDFDDALLDAERALCSCGHIRGVHFGPPGCHTASGSDGSCLGCSCRAFVKPVGVLGDEQ